MPPRTVQTNPNVPQNHHTLSSILDKIRPIEQSNYNRLKWSVYGDIGVGKSRFSCTFPKPLLLIAVEKGTDSVVGTPGIDVSPLDSTGDLFPLLDHAVDGKSQWSYDGKEWKFLGIGKFQGDKYRTIVLDTATKLKRNRITEIFASMGKEVPRVLPPQYAGKEWKDVWTQTSADMQKLLGAVLSVPDNNDLCVVINCHEANLTYDKDEGNSSTSEFLKPNISSAVGKAVAEFMNAEVSYLGQMLIRDKYEEREEKMGDVSNTVKVRTASEYVMRIGPDAVYRTKFRRPLTVTKPLPDFIIDPNFEKIIKIIKGEY